ncbi:hypothetical protein Goklo_023061 [Gossypium klotzschianum]|uniref:Reverse transcriptase RNase H-like domain-containing protein n=1 Tax=Gossypium klotzschianum TaxID=34286 RepID=A0A7J8TPC0_9ROSI|nr:hypothetical protein [Gossypium klotzschianum]
MDMFSFPKMLKFKQKEIPHPQLLRWSEWFSKYSFDVKHIKGKTNVLADILTRPVESFIMRHLSSYKSKGKKKLFQNPPSPFSIPCQPNSHPDHPLEYLCQINKIIPSEIWPSGKTLAPWDVNIDPPTPYQEQLKKALKEYQSDIPDPKEWSQDYPMYCSQATQNKLAWKDVHEDIFDKPLDDLEEKLEQLKFKCYRSREEKKRKIEELNITSDISIDYDTD